MKHLMDAIYKVIGKTMESVKNTSEEYDLKFDIEI